MYRPQNPYDSLASQVAPVMVEDFVKEYSVMIDSGDRNYQVYPDPFCYDVIFGPLPAVRSHEEGQIFAESPAPTISESFKDVRYIKLQEVILPLYTLVRKEREYDEDGDFIERWKLNVDKPLTNNPYLILSIGDSFCDDNYRSTNDVFASSFSTIYFSRRANGTHFFGCTSNGHKKFPQDSLARINKFRISFMDPYGERLRCPHLDKRILSNRVCTCLDPEGDEETDCFRHNLFHPANPHFQHHLHFKIGVSQPRLYRPSRR